MRLKEFLKDGGSIDSRWDSMSIPERISYIKQDLLKKGYTQNQTAAILGNLLQENTTLKTNTQNTKSGALGIAQWLGSRKAAIINQGKHSTITGQLDFLDKEIKGSAWTNNMGGKKAFFSIDEPAQLTRVFRKDFERPGEAEANDNERIANAYRVLGLKVPSVNSNEQSPTYNSASEESTIQPLSIQDTRQFLVDDRGSFQATSPEFGEFIRLENEKTQQEQKAKEAELRNQKIQAEIEQKSAERNQLISMIPQAQYVGLQPQQFQKGGTVDINKIYDNYDIEEVVIKPEWVKYRAEFIKNNPKEKFIQQYLDTYKWSGQSLQNYPNSLDQDYENMIRDYVGQRLVEDNPKMESQTREEWLNNSFTKAEQELIQRNPLYQTSLWQDTEEGVKSLFNLGNNLQIERIKNSDNYTELEKQQLIQQHENSPILSNIGDVAQSLSFLTVPSKMVQSVLRPEYSFSDALHGTKNKASMVEDVLTDPLTYTGVGLVEGIGDDVLKQVSKAGKYLTEETPLKNAYKVNPWAFKPSSEMGYRMLGKEGFDDALETGVLRAKPSPNQPTNGGISLARNTNRNPNTGKLQGALDRPYFADGFIDERYASDYMAAVNKVENGLVSIPTHKGIAPGTPTNIPIENAQFYKKDWLRGYKPIEIPESKIYNNFSNSNFKSEINWGNWNKEIPDNTKLMQEYNAIEQTAKQNGSWMKNPDGSAFQGTPEQFIQQNSENYKKAFGNSKITEKQYHTSSEDFNTFDTSKSPSGGIFFTPDRRYTETFPQIYRGEDASKYKIGEYYINSQNPLNINDPVNHTNIKHYIDQPLFNKQNRDAIIGKEADILGGKSETDVNVIFNSNQIKSAIGNNGMFDLQNPNIYKTLIPATGMGVIYSEFKKGGEIKSQLNKLAQKYQIGGKIIK